MNNTESCIMVIFGGTGDLTHRKLMPALYNLAVEGLMPRDFTVVAIGRKDKDDELYQTEVQQSVQNYSRVSFHQDFWKDLKRRIHYLCFNFDEESGYKYLNDFLTVLEQDYQTNGNRIFYLAVAPEYFEIITKNLQRYGLIEDTTAWHRLVIEKPFGKDLHSAVQLNRTITAVFPEENIYRIDHYLGKEMLQNIMAIRFANVIFEPLWNSRFIDNIQISSTETLGVESRGGYYEKSGAIRDMLQNHMLQLLTLIAMEPPVDLSADSIHEEKVKVLRSLEIYPHEVINKKVIRGQYGPGLVEGQNVRGYREEEKVAPNSEMETFIALEANIQNFRWAGTPFYIRTGKRLPVKSTEIVIEFKPLPGILYSKQTGVNEPNLLVIRIQPKEGIFFQFNAKNPGTGGGIIPVQMDFCQNCQASSNSPESYERLIYDVMRGDSTLFTRWDEVEHSWRFVDSIIETWATEKPEFPNYQAGSWGPVEADELLKSNGRKWRRIG